MLLRRMAGRHLSLSGFGTTCVVSIAGDIWDRDSYRNYCDQTIWQWLVYCHERTSIWAIASWLFLQRTHTDKRFFPDLAASWNTISDILTLFLSTMVDSQFIMWVFPKWWYSQIIQFNGGFHYKPCILGYPYFRKHPCLSTSGGYFIS